MVVGSLDAPFALLQAVKLLLSVVEGHNFQKTAVEIPYLPNNPTTHPNKKPIKHKNNCMTNTTS